MTTNKLFILIISLASLLVISCEKDPVYDVEITTDASSYALSDSLEIQVSVSNNSDSTIYFICTGQVYLEELSGQQVGSYWMVHGSEECLGPGPISASQVDTFQIQLGFLHEQGHLNNALFDNSVKYRLRFDLFEEKTFKTLLEGSNILSNTFSITQ